MAILILLTLLCNMLSSLSATDVDYQNFEAQFVKFDKQFRGMSDKILILEQSITELMHANDVLTDQVVGLQKENEEFRRVIDKTKRCDENGHTPNVRDKLETHNSQHGKDQPKDDAYFKELRNNTNESEVHNIKVVQPIDTNDTIDVSIQDTIDVSVQESKDDSHIIRRKSKGPKGINQATNDTEFVTKPRLVRPMSLSERIPFPGVNFRTGRQLTEQNEQVAFSLFLKNDIVGLTKGHFIKFDGIMVNDGNGYDVSTGIFTAPRKGLYLFSFVIEDYHDQDLWADLYQDGHVRSKAVAEPYDTNQNTMGGNVVLLHVAKGSKVWIQMLKGNRVQGGWSTFSGVLLH